MPKRTLPNRLACEAALHPEDLIGLRRQVSALGVPLDKWHLVPSLGITWSTLAAARIAERLRGQSGISKDRALAEAAVQIGLNEDTIASRLKDFRRDSRRT